MMRSWSIPAAAVVLLENSRRSVSLENMSDRLSTAPTPKFRLMRLDQVMQNAVITLQCRRVHWRLHWLNCLKKRYEEKEKNTRSWTRRRKDCHEMYTEKKPPHD